MSPTLRIVHPGTDITVGDRCGGSGYQGEVDVAMPDNAA